MKFRSIRDLARDVITLVPFCIDRDISAIYGVPRSGMLPATILATALQLPLGMAGETIANGRRVEMRPRAASGPALLIDDSVGSGGSMEAASRLMEGVPHLKACAYLLPGKEAVVDAYAVRMDAPRIFEWNLFNCDRASRFMFDLDGVFCYDPKPFDDDGPEYEGAIRNAIPKYLSLFPVGWICTNRIERWRSVTEAWLGRHGIRHGELIMQPFDTASERRDKSWAPTYKATYYRETPDAKLFVESHDAIASEIFRRSEKPVLSLESMEVYQ